MLILLTSPSVVAPNGEPIGELAKVLVAAGNAGNPVAIVSNSVAPPWFDRTFDGTPVQFFQARGRQNGRIVAENAERLKLSPHDVLVLAGGDADVRMGKNSGAVLMGAGWSGTDNVRSLGIEVESPAMLHEVIQLCAEWSVGWWFSGAAPSYEVRALADLSSRHNKPIDQQIFGHMVTGTVKNGGSRLTALLTVAGRSLLGEGLAAERKTAWGVYPSSRSTNDDNEVLSDLTHRLRTTISRDRFAEREHPLFVRHTISAKRSTGGGGDRADPSEQIETIHLNPHYRKRLQGRLVVIVDDCTTYGVSFGVAAAFLRKGGARKVLCVALGKFGNTARSYDIDIQTDPFRPVLAGAYRVTTSAELRGQTSNTAQDVLRELIQ